MVISQRYKYIFIELPRTGTTAIANELCELYNGTKILSKHATYADFLDQCTSEEADYFSFSCRRHPIDRTYSYFIKMKNGYYDYKFNNGDTTLYEKVFLLPMVKWVKENDVSFQDFLEKRYKLPYTDWRILNHKELDFIINFESLNADFIKALNKINIDPVRDLPKKNVTGERKEFTQVVKEVDPKVIRDVFGPFLISHNYNTPHYIKNHDLSFAENLKFSVSNLTYRSLWKLFK